MNASLDAEDEGIKKAVFRYLRTVSVSPLTYREIDLRYSQVGLATTPQMTLISRDAWEAAAGVTLVAGLTVGAVLYLRRKRPTEEELERARRKMLASSGRVIDGMLLDIREITVEDGRSLTMLEYSYRSAGVDYECSQDITTLLSVIDMGEMRAGFPCSVRYQPGNPQNSIVISETWSGLRSSLPVYPLIGPSKHQEIGQLRPDRG
jgi:hypothetical protein